MRRSIRDFGSVLFDNTSDTNIARYLGVSRSTVGRWRKDWETMPINQLVRLAKRQGYTLILHREERDYA